MKLTKNLVSKLFILLVVVSCSHMRSGKYVKVRSEKELAKIAKSYGTSLSEVKKHNPSITPGEWVFIPSKVGILKSRHGLYQGSGNYYSSGEFLWPVPNSSRISSYYGPRNRRLHAGVDIAAPKGSSVLAAQSGKVIFSGWMRGYGRVVIIRHANNFNTVYAHNSRNLKSKGSFVDKGDVIAQVGRTGRATGNHLHFEVRVSDKPVDPMRYFNSRVIAHK